MARFTNADDIEQFVGINENNSDKSIEEEDDDSDSVEEYINKMGLRGTFQIDVEDELNDEEKRHFKKAMREFVD